MPVGLVAFVLSSPAFSRRLKTKIYSEADGLAVRKKWTKFLNGRARPSSVTVLLVSVAVYLVLSRSGPFLTRVGESTAEKLRLNAPLAEILDPVGLQSLKEVFRGLTKVPGPISSRRSFSIIVFIMGNSKSKKSTSPDPGQGGAEGEVAQERRVENLGSEHPKEGSPGKNLVKYYKIEDDIKMGSLAILKRAGEDIRHFAVFVQHDACDPEFPTMLVKGKTKPLLKFDPTSPREAHLVTAASRIFYGDYDLVAVRYLKEDLSYTCGEMQKFVDEIPSIAFTDVELKAIENASSAEERSAIVCTFMVAYYYKLLKVLKTEPNEVTPTTLENFLDLEPPQYIDLPPVKEGPVAIGDPPFLSRLVDGIFPPPDVQTQPLSSLLPELKTGDIVLFSGATSSGAIIKFFDHSEFSHCGIVVRSKYSSRVMIWEASTNKAGLVDVETGKVQRGVELLPLRNKIFSGWYNRVAIRRLTGIDDERRSKMYKDLLEFRKEVQGRPYEKSNIELILSAIDAQEEYLSFLRNTKEDISSLFCSELVAAAYKKMGLLDTKKLSNEFTPDDFASKNDKNLKLTVGKLGKEEYVELKFDLSADGLDTMDRPHK